MIIENCICQKYIGGMGTEYFDANSWQSQAAAAELAQGNTESIIAVAVPKGDLPDNNILDITGRFHPSVYERFTDKGEIKEHYYGSGNVYSALGLDQIDMYRTTPDDEFLTRTKRINTVCWRGMELRKDPVSGDVKPVQLNTGHLGKNLYAGVRAVLDGEMTFMRDCRWSEKMDLV